MVTGAQTDLKDRHIVHVGDRGRIVLPAELRRALAVRPGDEVILIVDRDGEVRMTSRAAVAKRCRGILTPPPRRDLVAELIAERRAEAGRD